jgi:hypothetical protein
MCLIFHKPSGAAMPDYDTILDMCYHNPDGAGFAFRETAKSPITLIKGFMSPEALADVVSIMPEAYEIIVHARYATQGDVSPAMCQPFAMETQRKRCTWEYALPLTSATVIVTDAVLAHNGVLHEYTAPNDQEKDLSDTAIFICRKLTQSKSREALLDKTAIQNNSRFYYMQRGKPIYITGPGLWTDSAGLTWSAKQASFDDIYDDDDDDCDSLLFENDYGYGDDFTEENRRTEQLALSEYLKYFSNK